jgi:hypothetical protein
MHLRWWRCEGRLSSVSSGFPELRTCDTRAGDIHKALRFARRSALVCGARGSLVFQHEYKVKLLSRDGPGVGMSTLFTFEI